MSAAKEFFDYIRRPFFTSHREPFSRDVLIRLAKLLGLTFLLLPVVAIIMGSVFAVSGVDMPQPSEGFEGLKRSPYFFLAAVIIAPLIEEVLFRSWLGSRLGIWVGLPVILFFVALFVIALSDAESVQAIGKLAPGIAVLYGLTVWNKRALIFRADPETGESLTEKIFPYVFWASAIFFGLLHLGNFDIKGLSPVFAIIVLPQFIVGLVLSYVRMRFGLLCAIGFHAAYNGVLVSLSLLAVQAA